MAEAGLQKFEFYKKLSAAVFLNGHDVANVTCVYVSFQEWKFLKQFLRGEENSYNGIRFALTHGSRRYVLEDETEVNY